MWRAAVDVGEEGNMTSTDGLAAYNVEGKYASFGKEIQLNYTLTVFEEGNIVNICADGGSHGTHVSGIIGAYGAPINPTRLASAEPFLNCMQCLPQLWNCGFGRGDYFYSLA